VGTVSVDQTATKAIPPRWQADWALAGVAFVWGVTFVLVKSALADISTIYFLTLRFGLAALCMSLLFAPGLKRAGRARVISGLKGGAIAGVFLWGGYMLQTFGLKYTSAGKSGFLTGLYIVLVPLLSAALYRRAPQLSEMIGILVATVGLVLLTIPTIELTINKGDLLTIGCAIAFALHLLVLGYYSKRENFEAVALGQITCAAVLSGLALALEKPQSVWSSRVVAALLVTSLLATALAFALQTWAQQYTTATRTALIFALEPVFALIAAIGLGGESITMAGLLGAALILTGILLVELKPAARR
jgi:drug/metabolite transporter (DMT)-like permease